MIAVIFALPEESKDLRRLCRNRRDIVIEHTGIGAEAARTGMLRILAEHRPSLVIGSGFAGALQPGLRTGDVVADRRGLDLPLPIGVREGRFATAPCALETPADKAAFGRTTGALAVEMESEAGGRVCDESGVPFIILRGISDAVDEALPVPMEHWFDLQKQRPRPAALLLFLALHPGRLLAFIRFMHGLAKPRAALARAIVETLATLPSSLR